MPLIKSIRRASPFALLAGLLASLLVLCLSACAPTIRPVSGKEFPSADSTAVPTHRQLIFVIHGDAGYIYYDTSGVRHLADTEALGQALFVARNAADAEVFIFHQTAGISHWFHPFTNGLMYHYRNGMEVEKTEYVRDSLHNDFRSEADLLHGLATPTLAGADPARVFLYFGHEIPIPKDMKYSRSLPGQVFSLADFTRGLQRFAGPAGVADPAAPKPFSLIVLSSCHGSTPPVTQALAPFTRFLLASSGELHLSYLDTRGLAEISGKAEPMPGNRQVNLKTYRESEARAWGEGIAKASFDRLKKNTRTAVTVSFIDMDKASAYLQAHENGWTPAGASERSPGGPPPEIMDCADHADFGPGGLEAGVTSYYRPPAFGRDKDKASHSGWGCPQFPALSLTKDSGK